MLRKILTRRTMAEKAVDEFGQIMNDGSDTSFVDDHQPNKRRHTQQQIQRMEEFFRDFPNPDSIQRRELGLELGLEPRQVKFWFQNKRTQLKKRHDHRENAALKAENKRLKEENMSHRVHLENASCISCGSRLTISEIPIHELRLHTENVQLRGEIDRLSEIAAHYVGKPATDSNNSPN